MPVREIAAECRLGPPGVDLWGMEVSFLASQGHAWCVFDIYVSEVYLYVIPEK